MDKQLAVQTFVSPIGLAITVIICGTILALVFGIMRARYTASVGKGGASLTTSLGDKLKKKSPHAACANRISGVDALRRTMEFTDHREELRNSILERQMDFYEEKEEEAKSLLKRAFGGILKEKFNIEDFSAHKAYHDFDKTLYISFGVLKKSVRKWFRNNHYDQLETDEQLSYIGTKKEIILDKVSEELTFNWFQEDVSRKEYAAAIRGLVPEFEELIGLTFSRAFSIARETHSKIRVMELNYCRFVKETFGEDAVILLGNDNDQV